jgi:hypothetical protein
MHLDQLVMWITYFSEPRGDRRRDFHAGTIVQSVHSIAASMQGEKGPSLSDCMIDFKPKEKVSDDDIAKRNLIVMQTMFKGIIPTEVKEKVFHDDSSESN